MIKYYNVYDMFTDFQKPMLKEATRAEVAEKIGILENLVQKRAQTGMVWQRRYKIELAGEDMAPLRSDYDEWADVTEPFHHVLWVKQDGKQLYINAGGTTNGQNELLRRI